MSRGHSELSDAFAFVLRRRRLAKRMSKEALAQKAGLHQTYIGLIERGARNPSVDASNAIAVALGVRLSKLIIEAEKILKGSESA